MSEETKSAEGGKHALFRHTVTINFPPDQEDACDTDALRLHFVAIAKKWIFQLERGDVAKKLHVQGRIDLHKKARCLTVLNELCRSLKFPKPWVTIKPEANTGGSFSYCMKDDTRVDGPWSDSQLYFARDLACMKTPLPWQAQVTDWIKADPDDRTVHWVFDPMGCHGKSKLCKWLCYNKLAERVPMGTATQIKSAVLAIGASRCYVVDIPRVRGSEETREALFSALEDIKNGWVQSAMYGKHSVLMMEPPHVVCFSNELPKFSLASMDRWRVWGFEALDKPLKRAVDPATLPEVVVRAE